MSFTLHNDTLDASPDLAASATIADSSQASTQMQTRVNSASGLDTLKASFGVDTTVPAFTSTSTSAVSVADKLAQLKLENDLAPATPTIKDVVFVATSAYSDVVFDYTGVPNENLAAANGVNVFGRVVVPISTDTRSHAGLSALGSLDQGTITSIITRADALSYFKHNLSKHSAKFRGTVFHIATDFADTHNQIQRDTESVLGFDSANPIVISSSSETQARDYTILAHALAKLTNSCVFHLFSSNSDAGQSDTQGNLGTDLVFFSNAITQLLQVTVDTSDQSKTINNVFSRFNDIANTSYAPITFFGQKKSPKTAIISLGSISSMLPECQTWAENTVFISVNAYSVWSLAAIIAAIPPSVESVVVLGYNSVSNTSRLYSDLLVTYYVSSPATSNFNAEFEFKNLFGLDIEQITTWFYHVTKTQLQSQTDDQMQVDANDETETRVQTPDNSTIEEESINSSTTTDSQQPTEQSMFNQKDLFEIQKSIVFKEAYSTEVTFDTEPEKLFSIKLEKFLRLTPDDYERNVFHLEFDTSGSGLKYDIGDALGVSGENDSQQIGDFLAWYNINPDEIITREISGVSVTKTAFQWLKQKIDLFGRPNKKFYSFLAANASDPLEAERLEWIISDSKEAKEEFKRRVDDTTTYADLLMEFTSSHPPITQLINNIPQIKQRHYSISSSSNMHPNKVHLLVVLVDWNISSERKRFGLCTQYLNQLKVGDRVAVSVKQSAMRLPHDDLAPVVMAGLGTGMAPFKAFVEERAYRKSLGIEVGPMALYFGSRSRYMEYLYAEDLEAHNFVNGGVLSILRLAFSRDQPEKVYIQHKLAADSKLLHSWLLEQNGSFYLCGPTWPVPDVKNALVNSFSTYGNMKPEKANKCVEDLKEKERYVLEVY